MNDQTAPRYDNKPAGTGDCGGNGLCATCVLGVLQGGENLTPRGASERSLLARRLPGPHTVHFTHTVRFPSALG